MDEYKIPNSVDKKTANAVVSNIPIENFIIKPSDKDSGNVFKPK